MVEEIRKQKKISTRKKFFYLLACIFLLATLATSFFGKKGFLDIQKSKRRYLELQGQIQELTRQKEKLELEIKELETNPRSLEREAREKLWLIKPDEKVIIREKK